MAAGAAQGAMIDRATPIAQQDAQQFFDRGNLSLTHQNQRDMAYIDDDLQRNQQALQQAIQQGNDQLATQLRMQINEQQEHLNRGTTQLQHGQTMQRDSTLHGYNREQDNWRHGQTLDRDSTLHGYSREQDNWRHGQSMDRDRANYDHDRTMKELGHVLGLENLEFAKNLDQRHQIQILEIGQDFQRLGQYESGLTNVWNGMLNMMTQSGATTPEQYQHLMNQMMPIMNNTRDFYSSLYGSMGAPK
jgi:uncharacterized protein YjgD (DUF1641 family)